MITRENYEIYFMEYMDGNLSAREQAEVEAFLLVYTDLRELLDGMDEVRLEVPAEVFGKKEEIKRTVRERELEYYAIATAEGVITDEEQAWVDGNVDKDVFEREVETCAKIKVKPDPTCRFEGKAGMYRKSGAVLFVKRYAAIAAVVALGIVVAIYSTRKEEFSMEDLPVTVVKTETILLPGIPEPEAIVDKSTGYPTASLVFPARIVKTLPDYYLHCPVGDIPMQLMMGVPASWACWISSSLPVTKP